MQLPPTIETWPTPPDDLAFGGVRLRFVQINPDDPARGLAPGYHFRILVDQGFDAGHVNFRVGDTDHLRLSAGHIGFGVRESFRGHGCAYSACRAIAPFVRTIYDAVVITCDPDNHASRRTIERLGARFLDEVPLPEHDPQYLQGSRRKRRYLWTP